jgi:uncharacterized phage-like protein YoqJ
MTAYRAVIAGSRSIDSYERVCEAIDSAPFDVSVVISGGATGVDTLGERWADEHDVPVERFLPADYEDEADDRGLPSPLVRNEAMAEAAEALIAVWDGESRGTKHMLTQAREQNLEVHFFRSKSRRLDEF